MGDASSGGSGSGSGSGASGSSLTSVGLSAYGTIMKGQGQQAADEFKAEQAEQAARFGREQADLTDVTMRERLNTTLANIDAIRAAGHVDPTSPTTAAVEDWQRTISNRQRSAAVITQKAQAASDEASAKYLREAGDFAMTQAYIGAGEKVASAVAKFALM
jgi:hypothetical protein